MAGYVFWIQVAQMWFLGPRPQDQVIFWDFIILLHFFHDSGKYEVLFVKSETGFWTYGWIRLLGQIPQMWFLGPGPQDHNIF